MKCNKCHRVKKNSCNALGMNFPKPSLRSSSSDVEKSPQDMSEKKKTTKVYQTELVFPTALGNLLYKLLSDCFFFSLLCFLYDFQHDSLTP